MEVVLLASVAYLFLGKLVQWIPRQYLLELGAKTRCEWGIRGKSPTRRG